MQRGVFYCYEAKARRQEPLHVLLNNEFDDKQLFWFLANSMAQRSLAIWLYEPSGLLVREEPRILSRYIFALIPRKYKGFEVCFLTSCWL